MRRSAALVLLLPMLALGACSADPGGPRQPAPDFTLLDLAGNPVRLSELRGQAVLIDFWATWCEPCVFQVPALNALWEAHREGGNLAVLGVAVDVEGAEVVAPWVEEHGVRYPILIGDEELVRRFGLFGLPALVLVDPAGDIVSIHAGVLQSAELEALVARASGSG